LHHLKRRDLVHRRSCADGGVGNLACDCKNTHVMFSQLKLPKGTQGTDSPVYTTQSSLYQCFPRPKRNRSICTAQKSSSLMCKPVPIITFICESNTALSLGKCK
jgi:hypothetical protein